jgi:hypothetical protein
MPMIDFEKNEIVSRFERKIAVTHQLFSDVVQAMQRMLAVARPLLEG